MGIISWIVVGAIAGIIAKLVMKKDDIGFVLTVILGIVGAVVGGWVFSFFGLGGDVTGFNLYSIVVSVIGAIIVLAILGFVKKS